ncbi:N-acetylmuramoyl-L-alanine amidase [Deinococcus taeanensis]|uniref:N-acetylmuramoyl-L-alanine amidase family protein n=1 Tax=Deinococcus taeanensis TaxID=2737050 RepID=UPI001CDBC44C|nr:N-acetylmuramoyl-L-alanine amidase [Deinococcus taeanensis]UBV41894.1 N-acetylmuramoyl-L-alanine amidase [Deinococcus taeanensis]
MRHTASRAALLRWLTLGAALSLSAARAAPDVFVAYPPPDYRVAFDHVILEGSVPPGATLTVSGVPVPTGPDGLFMSWWPLKEGTNDLRLVARLGTQAGTRTLRVTRTVTRPLPATPTAISRSSVQPTQPLEFWDPAGDTLPERQVPVRFQGAPGGRAYYRVADGPALPMTEGPAGTYAATYAVPPTGRLAGATLTVSLTGRDGRTVTVPAQGTLSIAPGTARTVTQAPASVPGLGLNASGTRLTTLTGEPLLYPRDGMTFRAVGRAGNDLRVRLAPGVSALITAAQTTPLGFAAPSPLTGGSLQVTGDPTTLNVRVPLGAARPPFTLTQPDARTLSLTLYGPLSAPLTSPDGTDLLLERLDLRPAGPNVTQIDLRLSAPAWGYAAAFDGPDLLITARRPPTLNPLRPLEGRVITLDPGHGGTQNGGAGSLGTPEKNLMLPVAQRAADLLRAQGATVNLTRTADVTLGLYDRGLSAEQSGSDLLISIHANALPDGRDPRGVRGPEVYFTHPQAQAAAAYILAALRAALPELGPGAGLKPGADLALTRPTTQPSLLIETAYLTDPGNLRLLQSPAGQARLAQAIAQGVSTHYAEQARISGP